jgi:hypothetical protein
MHADANVEGWLQQSLLKYACTPDMTSPPPPPPLLLLLLLLQVPSHPSPLSCLPSPAPHPDPAQALYPQTLARGQTLAQVLGQLPPPHPLLLLLGPLPHPAPLLS